jgi:hypothetical protein
MRMINIEWSQNMGMHCARGGGNRKDRTWNKQNREWQNAEWLTTIAALISSRDSVLLCFNFLSCFQILIFKFKFVCEFHTEMKCTNKNNSIMKYFILFSYLLMNIFMLTYICIYIYVCVE